jgi:hypothetical protein
MASKMASLFFVTATSTAARVCGVFGIKIGLVIVQKSIVQHHKGVFDDNKV